MKSLIKLGALSALALGSVAAHAGIVVPTSSSITGDLVLFADVFNSSGAVVSAYAGDTNISVDSIGSGTEPTGTFTDANLNTLLANAGGNTVMWALEGGGAHGGGGPYIVTSGTSAAIGTPNGAAQNIMETSLRNTIHILNGTLQANTSLVATTTNASLGGNGFNPTLLAGDQSNFNLATGNVATTGLDTQASLFTVSAGGTTTGFAGTVTPESFVAELTSTGLIFTNASSGSVPLPGAVWLLGSGLLGLAGVARRKIAVV